MTTAGDILIRNASNVTTRYGVSSGAVGSVLMNYGTPALPTWITPADGSYPSVLFSNAGTFDVDLTSTVAQKFLYDKTTHTLDVYNLDVNNNLGVTGISTFTDNGIFNNAISLQNESSDFVMI